MERRHSGEPYDLESWVEGELSGLLNELEKHGEVRIEEGESGINKIGYSSDRTTVELGRSSSEVVAWKGGEWPGPEEEIYALAIARYSENV